MELRHSLYVSSRLAALATLWLWATVSPAAQDDPVALPVLLQRAAEHVDRYASDMSRVVMLEVYSQALDSGAGRSFSVSSRETKADILLLHVDAVGWVPFRDVFEVDGHPVRERGERVKALLTRFDPESVEQALAIRDESARFNLSGIVDRTINTPMSALRFLQGGNQPRSSFRLSGTRTVRGTQCQIVDFVEREAPSLIHAPNRTTVTGRFWIEPKTGAVLQAEMRLDTPQQGLVIKPMRARVTTTFRHDGRIDVWVPDSMEEVYDLGPNTPVLSGRATYTDARIFGVTTGTAVH